MLTGRRTETRTLDGLLADVRAGESRALVIHGEQGVGKTALLEELGDRAAGCLVARAAGVQSEMELPFAAAHQLCAPMLDRLEHLPAPQRDALRVTFGITAGPAPDRFLVGLAVLSLLAEAARDRPLVCLVDDAQWLDRASAQTLAFAARRLSAESVALVFAVRDPGGERELGGLPDLLLEGLANGDARTLLASVIRGRLDDRVRDRIIAETRGNPLALLELPRELTPAELAGGFGLPDALPLPARIEASYRKRLSALPGPTRRLLLIAAAEPAGEPGLVWRAGERLGIGPDAARPAAAAGLVEFGGRVRFRHPLVRSAIYRAASPEERRTVHLALAEATDPDIDPDRRAWHHAHATTGEDEGVAAELERSAGRAQGRGGLAAAAAFLERAAQLTPAAPDRTRRALAAANAHYRSGAPDVALRLLATAQAGPVDELQLAGVELLRARIAFTSGAAKDTPKMLLDAARRLEPLDRELGRETYLHALYAAIVAGRLASGVGLRDVASALRAAPRPSGPARASDLLVDGWVVLITEGYAAGAPRLQEALQAFCSGAASRDEALHWLGLAVNTAFELGDDRAWNALAAHWVKLAREAGALIELAGALHAQSAAHLFAGETATATALLDEADAITQATGSRLAPWARVWLAAFEGREAEAAELIEAGAAEVVRHGEGLALAVIDGARALLANGLGRYEEALAAAQRANEQPYESPRALPDLIEAAVRTGRTERAAQALDQLTPLARATGTDWALGVEAYSRALLTEGDAAEAPYREAVERLERTRHRLGLARAHLLYGEWLRRERRRRDAREQLRIAHDLFTAMGARAFAGRAARELSATGETTRKRTVEARGELTAQETQIARLAGDGLSNSEIGSRLFISPRTVEYHLHKVFAKLAIGSRMELAGALAESAAAIHPHGHNGHGRFMPPPAERPRSGT